MQENRNKVVVRYPITTYDPFTAYEWRKLPRHSKTTCLVTDDAILGVNTLSHNFGVYWCSNSTSATTRP